jgi:hypothetical protein
MNAKRLVPAVVVLTLAGVAAVVAFWPTCQDQKITTTPGNPAKANEDFVKATPASIAKLKQRIAEEKTTAEDAVNRYAPAAPGEIDDLTTSAGAGLQAVEQARALGMLDGGRRFFA